MAKQLKALLKSFLRSPAMSEAVLVAEAREPAAARLKEQIGAFVRGERTVAELVDAFAAALEQSITIGGRTRPLWGFGGPGTLKFAQALSASADPTELEGALRTALIGVDRTDPAAALRAFAAFVIRAGAGARGEAANYLHVGYATCFLSFLWHILYDQEIPVFYGASHKAIKELIAAGAVDEPGYGSRDLGERFTAFLRISARVRDILQRVNPQLGYWTVEAFYEWFVQSAHGEAGTDSGLLSGRVSAPAVPSPQVSSEPLAPVSGGAMEGRQPEAFKDAGTLGAVVAATVSSPEGTDGARTAAIERAPLGSEPVSRPAPAAAADATAMKPQALAELLSLPERWVETAWQVLESRGRLLIAGAPLVGKTHVARRLAQAFGSARSSLIISVHPGLHYADLVERREASGAVGRGVMLEMIARATQAPNERFVVVLDDLCSVDPWATLGALLPALEHRNAPVALPVSGELVSVPSNFFVIATDGGIGSRLWRRELWGRFPVLKLEPNADALRRWLEHHAPTLSWLVEVWQRLVARLGELEVGGRIPVGHGLFMQSGLDADMARRIVEYEVLTCLELEGLNADALAPLSWDALTAGLEKAEANGAAGALGT